jgi:hypothetical protein
MLKYIADLALMEAASFFGGGSPKKIQWTAGLASAKTTVKKTEDCVAMLAMTATICIFVDLKNQ